MSMSSYELGERKECGGGSGGVECNGRKAGADTTVRWRRNESNKIEEDHDGEGLVWTCSRQAWHGWPRGVAGRSTHTS
jgi:hypothetical protein